MSRSRILAVASGKGGVGKTLTSVNIALSAAREGVRTALVDADPLSNVMAMLDHPLPERALPDGLDDPESQAFIVAPRFEVLFPQAKKSADQAAGLVMDLLNDHRSWLDKRYGLVIVDMPAGAEVDIYFPYLPLTDALLLVTNPEPTAHVAAGTLLKNIRKSWGKRPVYLWHNKYVPRPEEDFDPDDLIGNYNRNVNKSDRIEPPELIPVAFVPPDPALDLNKADPPILVNLHRSLVDTLDGLADAAMPPFPSQGKSGFRSAALVAYFLRKTAGNENPDILIADLEKFLGAETLPDELKKELRNWLVLTGSSPLRRQVLQAGEVVSLYIGNLESKDRTFASPAGPVSLKAVDREIAPLLKSLSCLPSNSPLLKMAGLLMFRFTLVKLFSSKAAQQVIFTFLPRRDENGQSVRDRHRQIVRLIGKDAAYQERYFALVKKLYPAMSRQLDHLVNTFGLYSLLFRNDEGSVARNVYARLFNATMYEIINSGLGVVAGFRFRPSSREFKKGFDELKRHLVQPRTT